MDREVIMFGKFLATEIHRIEVDKWYEGERISADPGENYCIRWVDKNAKWFRDAWENSCCKDCSKWKECGHEVKNKCSKFSKDDLIE